MEKSKTNRYDLYRIKALSTFRAYLPIRLSSINSFGKKESTILVGLIDTGADSSVVHGKIADTLNHCLTSKKANKQQGKGVANIKTIFYQHTFTLEVLTPNKQEVVLTLEDIELSCHTYSEKEPINEFDLLLLGVGDVLKYFNIEFDFKNGDLYIKRY